ncbi:MAG: ferredoxin--NADP reductase [Thermoanaerobaculia bacterium]|nr:ferredoxin--NADP reductase [Thermoanaerobaculia bacterium]
MEQLRRLLVVEKRRETPDAITLVLAPEDGQPYSYQPGQYLSVVREINGREKRRAYSFSSCPGIDEYPAITVKRIPNGEFSNWLMEKINPGDVLLTGAPAGRFLLPEKPPRRLVYLAAGSGITPVFSHLKALFSPVPLLAGHMPVTLLYANRDRSHTIFKNNIEHWTAVFPERFRCIWLFTRDKAAPDALHGHLNNALFESLLKHISGGRPFRTGTHFYLCAPNALMRMARMTLRVLDVPETNIHQETFAPDTRLPKRPLDTSKTHRIVVTDRDGERTEFQIYAGETILNGALRQNIRLPYTCKSGVCLSCLARCRSGEVELDFVEQTRREGPGALINTCVGYPVTGEVQLVIE